MSKSDYEYDYDYDMSMVWYECDITYGCQISKHRHNNTPPTVAFANKVALVEVELKASLLTFEWTAFTYELFQPVKRFVALLLSSSSWTVLEMFAFSASAIWVYVCSLLSNRRQQTLTISSLSQRQLDAVRQSRHHTSLTPPFHFCREKASRRLRWWINRSRWKEALEGSLGQNTSLIFSRNISGSCIVSLKTKL